MEVRREIPVIVQIVEAMITAIADELVLIIVLSEPATPRFNEQMQKCLWFLRVVVVIGDDHFCFIRGFV